MTQYIPPINERESGGLWLIAVDDESQWQQDAIDQATSELIKRGATKQEFIDNKVENIEFTKRLELLNQIEIEKNKIESYSSAEKITVFILAPFYLFYKFPSSEGLLELKAGQYNLKYKQRLLMLIAGIATWIIILFVVIKINGY